MAATIEDVVSLGRLLSELHLQQTVEAVTRLGPIREAAVAFVGNAVGYPLVDRDGWFSFPVPVRSESVVISDRPLGVISLERAGTWPSGEALPVGDPTHIFTGAHLRHSSVYPGRFYVAPPVDGWPMDAAGLAFELKQGLDLSHPGAAAIQNIVVLVAREFYDGHREIRENHPINLMLDQQKPLVYSDPGPEASAVAGAAW